MLVVEAVGQGGEITTGASYSTACPPILVGVGVLGGGVDTVGDPGRVVHASGGGGGLCGGGGELCVGGNNMGENDGVGGGGGECGGEAWSGVFSLVLLLMVVVVTVKWRWRSCVVVVLVKVEAARNACSSDCED